MLSLAVLFQILKPLFLSLFHLYFCDIPFPRILKPVFVLFKFSESDEHPSSPPFSVEVDKFSEIPISDFETADRDRDFETGDFIDDDFGLSIRQESEKLRQQQLLIEQEVRHIFRWTKLF